MLHEPTGAVLRAFGCNEPPTRLAGGQGATWRSGDIVLKPIYTEDGAVWEAETLSRLPGLKYRIAQPVRTVGKSWTHNGWTACRFVEGVCPKGTYVAERFAAARALHADLQNFSRPAHFDSADDPWGLAEQVAFGSADWVPHHRIAPCLARLRRLRSNIQTAWQIIHADLAGNFLLLEGHTPAIIDFTPKWSPVGFGEAVFAVDVHLWESVRWETVLSQLLPAERQLLPLAATRRLLEVDTLHRSRGLPDNVFDQVTVYEGLATKLEAVR